MYTNYEKLENTTQNNGKDKLKTNLEEYRLLIVYGSNYGSTSSIVQRIGKILEARGASIEILNAKEIKRKSKIALDQYSGILLGSGVYAGKWTPKMKRFIKKRKNFLPKFPLAAFAVCGQVHDPNRKEIAQKKYVEDYLNQWGLHPDFGTVFAGVLDLSKTSPYGQLELKIVRLINKNDSMVLLDSRNDYRNWDEVEKFALDFAHLLPYIVDSKKKILPLK